MPDIEKNGYGIPQQMIQGGCSMLAHDPLTGISTWTYVFEDSNGPQVYVFSAEIGQSPQIGDTIVNGALQKKTGALINNDPGFQAKKFHDHTWPDDLAV